MDAERQKEPEAEDVDRDPEAPNEGGTGHHPEDDDVRREDAESEQSFPASDPPANY